MKTLETFDSLLDRLWMFDSEVFAHDFMWVFINYRTHKRVVFHNSVPNDMVEFIDENNPIFCGYNAKGYDKYILKACLLGYSPEEIKEINDFIIGGGNGWEYPMSGYCEVPIIWDLFDCIKTFKSLKEIEGNLRMNITETTIPFDMPTKWNKQQYEEVLYYCNADVEALFPLFERLMGNYKSKYIICQVGKIEPDYGLSMTDANLTATILGAESKKHDDPFLYVYPEAVEKDKIPKEALEYFDDLIAHNDIKYKRSAPTIDMGTIDFQIGIGGGHAFVKDGVLFYDRGDNLKCE